MAGAGGRGRGQAAYADRRGPRDGAPFIIWGGRGGGTGAKLLTQMGGARNTGHIFSPEMNPNRMGRLDPGGASPPTVVAVPPVVVPQPAPPRLTALPASVVYTPI